MLSRFVFGLMLVAFSISAHAELKGFGCVGTEPFFSIDINLEHSTLTYSAPEVPTKNQAYTVFVKKPVEAAGVSEGSALVIEGKARGVTATLISENLAGKCSDGMSDSEYSHHLIYTSKVGGKTVVKYGCCERKAQDND